MTNLANFTSRRIDAIAVESARPEHKHQKTDRKANIDDCLFYDNIVVKGTNVTQRSLRKGKKAMLQWSLC